MASGVATTTQGQTTAQPSGQQAPAVRPIQFTRASIENTQPAGVRSGPSLLTALSQQVGPSNIKSLGYMMFLTLRVVASGGDAGAATVAYDGDAPWSVLTEVLLQDINGTPILQTSGYELFLINAFGGYDFSGNPTNLAGYSAPDADGNFIFTLRVPVQIRQRDALGCLANMNAAASYQLKYTVAPSNLIYATPPDTLPSVTVESTLHAWALPGGLSATGAPQAIEPAALGTTQYWTRQAGQSINAGQNDIQLTRVGNLIRNLIFVARGTDGVRSDSVLLNPFQLKWDNRIVLDEPVAIRRDIMGRRFSDLDMRSPITTAGNAGYSPLAGVMVIDQTHSFTGHPGDGDLADLWLPTASSTRLDYSGVAAANGSVTVVCNDVIPAGDIFSLD